MRLAILFLAVWCGGIAGQTFSNYPIPTASSNSQAMVSGSDGALWFVEEGSNKIGRITTSGVVTEYPIPTSGAAAFYITSGPDQALWFTECAGNKIGRITTGGVFSEYPIPSSGSCPLGITTGSDGALWFAGGSNMIGRITTSGTITTFSTSTQTNPNDITSGPDSALWFTEGWVSQIGRITTSGTITEYPVSSASGNPSLNNIVSGSDGALWFTLGSSSNIGRITTTGTVTLFPLLSSGNYGNFIIPAPDGSLYFTMSCFANSIGRITTSGSVSQDPIPSPSGVNVCGQGIILGPDNALWFTADSSQIWRMTIPSPAVDGGWSAWSTCNVNCTQSRQCNNPPPSGSGAPCSGASSQSCIGGSCGGGASSSTGGGGSSGTAALWAGTWNPTAQCSQTQCCCLVGTVTISATDASTVLMEGPVAGSQCGTTTTVSGTLTGVTSNTWTGVVFGNHHSFTLSANGNTITDTNTDFAACSGAAIRETSDACHNRVPIWLIITLLAFVIVA